MELASFLQQLVAECGWQCEADTAQQRVILTFDLQGTDVLIMVRPRRLDRVGDAIVEFAAIERVPASAPPLVTDAVKLLMRNGVTAHGFWGIQTADGQNAAVVYETLRLRDLTGDSFRAAVHHLLDEWTAVRGDGF